MYLSTQKYIYRISSIYTTGVLLFSRLKSKRLYLNNATVWFYSRVRCYFYTQIQVWLYVISFLFFDNQLLYPEQHYYLLQAIIMPDNAPVRNGHSGCLKLSFISMCVSYIFNIPPQPVIFLLYLFVITQIRQMKLSSLHDKMP